jgi:hypothetical protein
VCICHDESNDGIPSFCKGAASVWCPLHPSNPLLATNKYVLMFGNLGLPHFDRHRRHYQGLALGWTILAVSVAPRPHPPHPPPLTSSRAVLLHRIWRPGKRERQVAYEDFLLGVGAHLL